MFQSYHLKWYFILLAIIALATPITRLNDFDAPELWQYITFFATVAITVLLNWLIHAYFKKHVLRGISNYTKAIISIVTSTLITLLLNYLIVFYIPTHLIIFQTPFKPTYIDFIKRLFSSFFLSMTCYIVYTTVYTNEILQKTRLENEQFKQAHLRAQLSSLQQQISPHFLFNSLSILKTIAQDRPTKTFVVQLAHVYRYLLKFGDIHMTKLSQELDFINSYLYIQHQRFETALKVSIIIDEPYMNLLIPPLSLQLLIENAIKHNAFSAENPLNIEISSGPGPTLIVQNTFRPHKVPAEGTGLGLQNVHDRFRLLLGQEIEITRTSCHFTVILPLIDYADYHH